jgi:hypothetical protein
MLMEMYMKESGKMIKHTDREPTFIKMELNILDNG